MEVHYENKKNIGNIMQQYNDMKCTCITAKRNDYSLYCNDNNKILDIENHIIWDTDTKTIKISIQ